MRFMAAVAVLGMLGLSGFPAGHDCTLADAAVENLIKSKARELKGQEYCQYRLYDASGDIDGDSVNDFVVIFTVEGPGGGGNFHESYMVVFLTSSKSGKPLFIKVGERGERDPESIFAVQGRIEVTVRKYLPKDPQCCPSGHGKVTFAVKGDKLVEMRPHA